MGAENLYGRYFLPRIPGFMSAKFHALGQAKVSLLLACLRKLILLIPLIFILPHFIQDKVFAVFLAEPISDIVAATITTITFMSRFNGILNKGSKMKTAE